MTKLAIIEEREEDKYDHILSLRHYRNGAAAAAISVPAEGIVRADERIRTLVDGVMKSLSSARQEEVQAWEEEILPCEHTFTLFQLTTGPIPASGACRPLLFLFLQLGLTSGGYSASKGWHIAQNATSRRTFGFASPAARSAADASFMAPQVGTATRSRISKRVSIRSVSNSELSRPREMRVSHILNACIHNIITS
jgi:hypothetical protein